MRPRWYFTAPQLNRYFTGSIKRWDVENIGALGEAFSIAGCDLMGVCWVLVIPSGHLIACLSGYLRNAKSRADWVKTEIRDKITAGLGEYCR